MPRMAERIAGTFVSSNEHGPRHSVGELAHHTICSRDNSAVMSSVCSSPQKLTLVETDSGALELESETNNIIDIIQKANMDGVRHLKSRDPYARWIWCAVIIVFIVLALIQIYSQISLYYKNPVATNIEAEYPSKIAFPTVAICNNNQFRLTYITGARIMNRRNRPSNGTLKSIGSNVTNVFDKVIEKAWDMDAVKFLRNAAHWKSRMILGCTWPNGTSCRLSDFRAVWTMTGLCWAINTNPQRPVEVTGSGAGHGLRLLLNVESYERVDSCTPHFRTKSLPGLKILIYNQTDVPESSLNGVNVPSGYSMDIPFKMQHRNKLPGVHCIEETSLHNAVREDFNSELNIRTCAIRKYMVEIEEECSCSFRKAYSQDLRIRVPFCTVDDYFGCVRPVVQRIMEEGITRECLPPCEVIDYTAWQDMNRLPMNLMPTLIEEYEEEDEHDVGQEDIEEEKYLESVGRSEETFSCEDSAYLDSKQVSHIKRDAHRAFEKQARYQEDIFLRTKRLIARLRAAIESVSSIKWGWHGDDFVGIYKRLSDNANCFANFSARHEVISTIMTNRPPLSEEKRASQIHYLLDAISHKEYPNKFKTIGEVKAYYGDKVEGVLKEIHTVLITIEKMWQLFDSLTYHEQLGNDVSRMDRIVELLTQYERGQLQRRAWAEKMQSRQMRYFFEEEFNDGWYQPIIKDIEHSLVKVIGEIEKDDWPKLKIFIDNGTAIKTGSIIFFEDVSDKSLSKFREFLEDMYNCTVGEVKTEAEIRLKEFKKAFRELQSSYSNLFKKELPDYLENFDFGSKFVSDNFAMVNIFFHQMHLERWSQDRTYGFWSLACDVGGALGLFLGASLLTIIELIYLCYQYGICGRVKDFRIKNCFKIHKRYVANQAWLVNCQSDTMKTSYVPSEIETFDKISDHVEKDVEHSSQEKNVWVNPYMPTLQCSLTFQTKDRQFVPIINECLEDLQPFCEKHEEQEKDQGKLSFEEIQSIVRKENQPIIKNRSNNYRLADISEENSRLDSEGAICGEQNLSSSKSSSKPEKNKKTNGTVCMSEDHDPYKNGIISLPLMEKSMTGDRKYISQTGEECSFIRTDPRQDSVGYTSSISTDGDDLISCVSDSSSPETRLLFHIQDRQTTI